MPEPTPEAWALIRHAYEHTDKPLAHICAEHDVSIPTLRYRMKVWQWRRRKPLIPREGPPATVLPLVIPACGPQAASPEPIAPPLWRMDSGPATVAASRNDEECETIPRQDHPAPLRLAEASRSDPPPPGEGEEIVPRLQSAVARVLPAIEATIARLASGSHRPREMEQAGRTLSSLTRTLRELNALLAEHNAAKGGSNRCCDCDDMPEDMDAFRIELARRIEAFVASRGGDLALPDAPAGEAKPGET